MKKTFSKSLSWLLSVVMIFGIVSAVPVIADATQTSSSFNQSYSLTGNSANDIVTVANAQMGKSGSSLGYSEQWCADFVCDCARYAGISDSVIPYNYSASGACTYLYNQMINKCGATPVSSAQAGDFIFWSNDSNNNNFGHVGIVVNSTNAISGNNGVNGDYNIYHTIVKNYKFSQSGYSNWVIVRPNYSNNPVPPPSNDWESMPVGEKYYLKNNGTGTYMSIDYGEDAQGKNISVYSKMDHSSQQFEIRSSDSDRTYYLRPVLCESSGRVVNVYSESSYNGANVTIYNFTGHSTQQWKFRKVDGGYAICSANNTNTCLAESGTNVQLATYTGASNQIWTLEPIIHVHNYTEYVYNWSAHPHYKCYRCSCGDVQENRNEPTYVDGCPDCIDQSRVDIGTDFYAYIINTAAWKMASVVGNSEYNVELESETGYSNQLWYFERQDNLYYKITNVKTNQCLDDANFGTTNGTNVGICGSNNGTAQRWALVECNGGYELHPQCAISMALDVNGGSTADGANIQIYQTNHSAAQIFTIYRYGNKPSNPELTSSGTIYNAGESITVSWNPCAFAHNYWIDVWHNDNHEQSFRWENLSYTLDNLDTGYYTIYVTACNHNGISDSIPVDFTVPDYSISPIATSSYNGHKYEYYENSLTWDQAYKFCERKGGHLVTITSENENDCVSKLAPKYSGWAGGRTFDAETWFWITCEPFDYQNWNEGEPNNGRGQEDALEIYLSDSDYLGKWNDFSSSNRAHFICEYEEIDASKYTPVYKENYNGHEYWFFEDGVDWQTAKKVCEAKGGYLAIPNNADENAFILSGIQKTSKDEAWIGITDIAKEGVWKNVKGGSITYSNWANDEPSNYLGIEDYVEMCPSGKWNDLRGFGASYRSVGFVCEFDGICLAGHTYTDEYIAATETETAHIVHQCSVCGCEWTESKTVFFETNGGTPVKAIDLLNKSVYGELPVTTKDGYTFKGWSLTANNTNSSLFTHDTAIYFQVPESWRNVQTVFCHLWSTEREDPIYKWQSEQEICENMGNGLYRYTIPSGTDANGVIFSSSSGYQTYDLAIGTVCENDVLYCVQNIPRSSYIYEGAWTVNKEFKSIPSSWYDGEGLVNGMTDPETIVINSYKFVNADTAIEQTGNHTLYAIWEIKHYTISYNMNGGNGTISKQTKTHGKDLTLSATIPTRADYKFVGWNTDKNATVAKYQPSSKYTANSNATLYAIWTVNHNYTAKVVAPTCTEKGYTLHTCTNCNDSYKDTYTNALGHDYKLTSEKAATCTTDGEKIYTCSRCGDTKTETVKATGHSYTTKVIAPTCTEKGYTLHTCSKCGDSYKDTYTNAMGHKYEETIVAPTTTEQGYTLHTCSVCKHSYKDNYTNILLSNNSTLSAETIKLGETITATAKATGGTGEYLYQVVYKQTTQSKWTAAQSYKANATVTFKPANAVTYDVCVKVKDSNNTEVKKFFTVKVTSDELKNVSTISAETINLGSTVTVNAKAIGSTGFYTYAVICVKVKDDKGTIVKKYFTVNVTDFTNTSTLSATEIKLGETIKVNCSATGSTGFYQYAIYYKKTSDTKWTTKQSYSSNNTATIKPAKATTYDVCVKVKDNQNNEVKKYFKVTVK